MIDEKNTVVEILDITDYFKYMMPINDAIETLKQLAEEYPHSTLNLTTESEYGEHYEKLFLHFYREKTQLEKELDDLNEKCRLLENMKGEAVAFTRNGVPYPRKDEAKALAIELGFFALAPKYGTLVIRDNSIVVSARTTVYRRDGVPIMRIWASTMGEDYANKEDEMARQHLSVRWMG